MEAIQHSNPLQLKIIDLIHTKMNISNDISDCFNRIFGDINETKSLHLYIDEMKRRIRTISSIKIKGKGYYLLRKKCPDDTSPIFLGKRGADDASDSEIKQNLKRLTSFLKHIDREDNSHEEKLQDVDKAFNRLTLDEHDNKWMTEE